MASHAKKKPIPVKWIVASLCSVVGVGILVAAILLINNGVLDTFAGLFQAASGDPDSAVSGEVSDPFSDPGSSFPVISDPSAPSPGGLIEGSGNYARPERMRGAWLSPGVDYLLSAKDTGDTVKGQIDAAFATLKEWEFNTVLLPLFYGDKALYASSLRESVSLTDGAGAAFDPLAYILARAREEKLYVYGIFDCRVSEADGLDPTVASDREALRAAAAEVAPLYAFDGYLVEDYSYALNEGGSYEAYMAQAPGVGFDQFTTDCLKAAVTDVVQALRRANRDYYVGLLSSAVWAHKRVDERGSPTDNIYEDMTDGHADTLDWVQDGLFDFVLVKNYSSTNHSSANFNNILDWWSSVCRETGLPLYIAHASDRVGSKEKGWSGEDQLARQMLACLGEESWQGSAFSSLAALKSHTASTAMLRKAMSGDYMSDYVSDTLVVNQPAKTAYTTNESKVSFTGSSNPNFPLTVNGKEIELSEHGYFSLNYDLAVGLNTFTFESNGVKKTYKITYERILLQSMEPTKNQTLSGGSEIIISAVALKDSTVYAMINGVKVAMKPTAGQSDEGGSGENSDYIKYVGSYILPDGIEGQAQKLGNVKVTVTNAGASKTLTGGSVTVEALPISGGGDDTPLPPVVGDLPLLDPSSGGTTLTSGSVVVVTSSYAETFSGSTTDDFSRPVYAYLPKGTTDRLVRSVGSYYLLGSGRRVYKSDAKLYDTKTNFTANTLKVTAATVENTYTRLSLRADWRIPYNVQLAPQYYKDPNGDPQRYDITKNVADLDEGAFTADHVDITFYYTTSVGAAPDFADSPVVKSAEWVKGADNTMILRLHLRQKGGFYGYSVVWDKDGTIHFAIKHPGGTAANSSDKKLNGIRIVLDPGHGGNSGTATPIGMNEKTLTLIYSKLLQEKLEALGAKVVMARTTADQNPTLAARADLARNNGTDLFISIHMNAGGGQGASYHSFNEYSYLIAQRMYAYARKVEDSYGLGKRYQPVTFSPFQVTRLHDCPAVLVECGFYDQQKNYDLLINPVYQDKYTNALVDGILDYFARLPVTRAAAAAGTADTVPAAAFQLSPPALLPRKLW